MTLEPGPNLFSDDILAWPCVVLGGIGIVFSAALGFAGLRVAAKTELQSAPKVFARGFAGVSSVLAFFASASLLVFGLVCLKRLAQRTSGVWMLVVGVSLACLAIEFGIGGALYARARRTFFTRALSVVSFLAVPVLGLLSLCALVLGVVWLFQPPT
jgi:hypothetical protein